MDPEGVLGDGLGVHGGLKIEIIYHEQHLHTIDLDCVGLHGDHF